MLEIIFYKTKAGNEPVRDWLKDQDTDTKKTIGEDLKTVQFGWPLGMPLVRKLEDGIFEVRVTLARGIARILFFQSEQNLVVVEGFIKKSQKTPAVNLSTAKARKSEYERILQEQKKKQKPN